MSLKSAAAAVALIALTAAGGAARAETIHFSATLSGADEVPPNRSAGQGEMTAELETAERVLVYRATYSGLSGPAMGAHFHGPAAPGANAPPVVPVEDVTSPIHGTAILTSDQADQLLAGQWYFNLHTMAHPGGEIRGQLKRVN